MTSRLADLAVSTTFAGSLLLASTSCATIHPDDAANLVPRSEVQAPGTQRLVQFSFRTKAAFGVCVEPACPVVTPKTLSIGGTAPMQAVTHRMTQRADATREVASPTQTAPAPPPTPTVAAPPPDTAVGNVVVFFPFASAQLMAPARETLAASTRHARQSGRIVISGRTDAVGNDKVNESLALARVLSVRDYLRDRAPDLTAVIAIDARGRCCFVASNETEDGRARNRRVEIAFFSQGGS